MTLMMAMAALTMPAPPVMSSEVLRLECNEICQQHIVNDKRRAEIRPYRAWLRRLRWCESTNNYRAVGAGGLYTGAYQFDDASWQSVGGKGRAMYAGKLEQDYRAVLLRKRRGTQPWPVCGA